MLSWVEDMKEFWPNCLEIPYLEFEKKKTFHTQFKNENKSNITIVCLIGSSSVKFGNPFSVGWFVDGRYTVHRLSDQEFVILQNNNKQTI